MVNAIFLVFWMKIHVAIALKLWGSVVVNMFFWLFA